MNIVELDRALKGVCPVYGVSIGDKSDKSTWRIDYEPQASEQEKDAARAVLEAAPAPLEVD